MSIIRRLTTHLEGLNQFSSEAERRAHVIPLLSRDRAARIKKDSSPRTFVGELVGVLLEEQELPDELVLFLRDFVEGYRGTEDMDTLCALADELDGLDAAAWNREFDPGESPNRIVVALCTANEPPDWRKQMHAALDDQRVDVRDIDLSHTSDDWRSELFYGPCDCHAGVIVIDQLALARPEPVLEIARRLHWHSVFEKTEFFVACREPLTLQELQRDHQWGLIGIADKHIIPLPSSGGWELVRQALEKNEKQLYKASLPDTALQRLERAVVEQLEGLKSERVVDALKRTRDLPVVRPMPHRGLPRSRLTRMLLYHGFEVFETVHPSFKTADNHDRIAQIADLVMPSWVDLGAAASLGSLLAAYAPERLCYIDSQDIGFTAQMYLQRALFSSYPASDIKLIEVNAHEGNYSGSSMLKALRGQLQQSKKYRGKTDKQIDEIIAKQAKEGHAIAAIFNSFAAVDAEFFAPIHDAYPHLLILLPLPPNDPPPAGFTVIKPRLSPEDEQRVYDIYTERFAEL